MIRVKRGAQDISLNAYAWRPREATSASLRVRLSSSATFCQPLTLSTYSSRLIQMLVELEVQSLALKWNCHLYPIVVGL